MKDFGTFPLRFRQQGGLRYIYDPIRRQWLLATPEEVVRQHVIAYLMQARQVPSLYIASEWTISRQHRADVVVFTPALRPALVVECKAPQVRITPRIWQQLFDYVQRLQPAYLWLTNGRHHWLAQRQGHQWHQIHDLPPWDELKDSVL